LRPVGPGQRFPAAQQLLHDELLPAVLLLPDELQLRLSAGLQLLRQLTLACWASFCTIHPWGARLPDAGGGLGVRPLHSFPVIAIGHAARDLAFSRAISKMTISPSPIGRRRRRNAVFRWPAGT